MKKIKLISILLATICINGLFAQPGTLDGDFDADGIVTTSIGANSGTGRAVAIQPDGKIVVAGFATIGSDDDFAVARYNIDGSLDNSFSFSGYVTTDFGFGNDHAFALALQPDGKIVVAGRAYNGTYYDFALIRYNTDGTLDNSFSVDGKLTTTIGTEDDEVNSIALQSDGKIVVAGNSSNGLNDDFALARYNSNGTLDISFDSDGKLITIFSGSQESAYSLAIQSDGKILAAGYSYVSSYDFALVRYNSDGSMDNSFSVDGQLTTDISTYSDYAKSIILQPDGQILVGGISYNGSDADFALVRYNTDGTLDNSFSVDGIVTTAIGLYDDDINSLALQVDGKILAAGDSRNGVDFDFALARYEIDGTLDNSFSLDGKLTTDIVGGSDYAYSVAIQPDYRIVLAGSNQTMYDNFALTRYLSGLNLGVVDLSDTKDLIFIYPNPVEENTCLEYSLNNEEIISIQLMDMHGQLIQTFIDHQKQEKGEHKQAILFPNELPSGSYFIVLLTPNGKVTVKIIKQH